jgi:hypothetical protein
MSQFYEAQKVIIALEAMSRHLSPPNNSRDSCAKCRDADTVDAAIRTIRELLDATAPTSAAKG